MWVCVGVYLLLAAVWAADRKKRRILGLYGGLGWKLWVLLLLIDTLALGLGVWQRYGPGAEAVRRLQRNGYGEGQREASLQMQIEGEEEEEVTLQIAPREYGSAELQALFRQAMRQLDETILGGNDTADHVTEDLELPTELEGYPFRIIWELSRYDVIDMTGRIDQEALKEELARSEAASEGVLVTVTALLRYQEQEASYSANVRLFAREEKPGIRGQVLALFQEREKSSRQSAYVTLPDQVEGRKVVWKYPATDSSAVLALLGVTACGLIFCLHRQKEEEKKNERKKQLLSDYPEIVSQFTMLMGAGMTLKSIWKKMAEDYREQKRITGKERAAYEEMLYTLSEMKSGIAESECYERFARRCEAAPYLKLGALLSQNLRKGVKGTSELLEMEAIQAMEEQKSRARRLGEEAGTKLLLPMLFMLVIVLAIVIVPAFLSVQI